MSRHRFDPISFVLGVGFLSLGVAAWGGDLELDDLDSGLLVPIALIVLGAALLSCLAGLVKRADDTNETPTPDR